MKSLFEASLIACLLAFAAGCSSSDAGAGDTPPSPEPAAADGDTAPLSQSLVAPRPPAGVNPCAAVLCPAPSTCEVVRGQAVCTPIEPEPPSGPFCGGFAGIECPGSGTCVDVPGDGCNPDRGGADCGGACECDVLALCVEGFVFDSSPAVCSCVPLEPEVDACASVRCRAGTHCEVRRDRARCVPDAPEPTNPCAAVTCLVGSVCEVQGDQGVCVPSEPEPVNPCAAVLCIVGTQCVVNDDGQAECVPDAGGSGGECRAD